MKPELSPLQRRLCAALSALAVLHIAGGLALPLVMALMPEHLPVMPAGASFWAAVFGPTLASWGVLMLALVHHGLRLRQVWACDALLWALLVWAPLDAWLCWRAGFYAALAVDLIMLPCLLLPLLILRRGFSRA